MSTRGNEAHGIRLLKILVIDDSAIDLHLATEVFEAHQHEVELLLCLGGPTVKTELMARTGEQPDLILLDLHMPSVDGFDLLRYLNTDPVYRRATVIILTSSKSPSDQERASELGVAEYLVKPISYPELVRMTATLVAHWRGVLLGAGSEQASTGRAGHPE